MARFATVRDLKTQTASLVREVEKGKAVIVTRRGKPVATLKPFERRDVGDHKSYPTSLYDGLKKSILEKRPDLKTASPEDMRREFDRISEKIRRSLPVKTWREMDRFVKGDRFGLRR